MELIEKDSRPLFSFKGVDISMAVRVVEDAHSDNYKACFIATSDIDFLPVIEAVRRMGKHEYLLAYPNGLGKKSPFQYVPDAFGNLRGLYGSPVRDSSKVEMTGSEWPARSRWASRGTPCLCTKG